MKRCAKLAISVLIVFLIYRLLREYLRPVRVRLDEHLGSDAPSQIPRPSPQAPLDTASESPAGEVGLDLNQADATALTELPGIGPALAERIVARRRQHGHFASLDDLTEINGIGPSHVRRLGPLVRFG